MIRRRTDRIRDAIETLETIREGVEGRDRDGITWVIGFLSGVVLPNVQSYRLERERRYFGFLTKRGQLCVRVWSRATYNSETADDPDDPNPIVKVIRPFYAVSSEDAIHKAADILRREMGIDIDPVEALKRNQRGE